MPTTNLVQAHPRRLDAEDPGDGRAQERGDDQDMQQRPGSDVGQEDGEEESRGHRADLGEGRGKACAQAADGSGEDLAGEQIGRKRPPLAALFLNV
jgi:hypothetical protein